MSLDLRFGRLLPLAVLAAIPLAGSAACNAQVATVLSSDAGGEPSAEGGTGGGAVCSTDPDCNDDASASSLWGTCVAGVCACHPGFSKRPNGKCNVEASAPSCAAKGGMCIPPGTAAPKSYRAGAPGEGTCSGGAACWFPVIVGSGPVCYKDQDCNNDQKISSLQGKCFFGVCMCQAPYTVQLNGKCDAPGPPDCTAEKGTCRQMPAECQMFEIPAQHAPSSCGDFVEAVCCVSAKLCNGPGREIPGGGFSPVDFVCCAPNDAIEAPTCVNGWRVCPNQDVAVEKPGGCGG